MTDDTPNRASEERRSDSNDASRSTAREGIEKPSPIEALEREFARGNYRLVREGAKALLGAKRENDVERARALLAKTSPDPWFLSLIGLSFVFFLAIAFYAYSVGQ